jgi:hypothetical protein
VKKYGNEMVDAIKCDDLLFYSNLAEAIIKNKNKNVDE